MSERRSARVMLVDDDEDLLELLEIRLVSAGYEVSVTASPRRALELALAVRPNVIVTDLRMAELDGMRLLKHLHERHPGLPVIMMTAHGTIPDAVEATRQGAFAFVTKPIDTQQLLRTLTAAIKLHGEVVDDADEPFIAHSRRMLELLSSARRIAATDSPVLLSGATGAGKDRIAQYIHTASSRCKAPFVAVNCGAIPESLFEAELFGHVRGAFTNAGSARAGLIASADGGTLFLDEVGDLPLPLQVKLLRALESGEIRALGSDIHRPVDVRIVSASNRDLHKAMSAGEFREDLYYRLNVVSMQVPSLCQRREDIVPLANHFLASVCAAQNVQKVYASEALARLMAAEWPGNVRQLRNIVEQNVALSVGPVLTAADVERALGSKVADLPKSYDQARQEFTRDYLLQLLQLTEGNVARAARLAKRNRTDFYKLMERHGISPHPLSAEQ